MSLHSSGVGNTEVPATVHISQLIPTGTGDAKTPTVGPLLGASGLPVRPLAFATATSDSTRPISPGSRMNVSSPASQLEGSDLEDDDVTMFLNFEHDDDVQLSSESNKKRRLEEGDASSPSQSNT